jgi:hypothetical protein
MKPNDFEQMLQQWTPKEVSPRIGRRLFGRDASADRRWCPLWVAPVATACFALALSVGGVRQETDGRWEGRALFQTNENQITLVAAAFDRAVVAGGARDWNRWGVVSFQSTNEWAPFSTTGHF